MSCLTGGNSPFEMLAKGKFHPVMFGELQKYIFAYNLICHKTWVNVLDIGAGKCDFRMVLNANNIQHDYYAVDLNDNINDIIIQQNNFIGHGYYYNMDALSISSLLNKIDFDLILLFDIVEHLDTLDAGLELIQKCLDKCSLNGDILLSTPCKINKEDDLIWPEYHLHEFTFDQLMECLDRIANIKNMYIWYFRGQNVINEKLLNFTGNEITFPANFLFHIQRLK